MCGICGFVGFEDSTLLRKMSKLQRHRGPDNAGFFIDKNVSLASQRLSIIDVGGGNQPIFNEDKSIAVVFNGEIFNFRELRKILETKGHEFYTESDTEVLVHSYEEWGNAFLEKLNGQFAFALFDSNREKLLLARDRFGIKPLFYSFYGGKFFFSSEIKPLTVVPFFEKKIDFKALEDYFIFGYVLSPKTIFSQIRQLLPGNFLEIEKGSVFEKKYYELAFDSSKFEGEKKSAKQLEKILGESVERQLVSDVPVGVFLSGGIDSSAITCFASKFIKNLNTFSAGFEEGEYNELPKARIVAEEFGTKHHEIIVTEKDFDNFPVLMEHFGEPFYDSSAIPTNAVSALATKSVKVVLSGEGGDELFAGYNKFIRMSRAKTLFPFCSAVGKFYPVFFSKILKKSVPRVHCKVEKFLDFCSMKSAEQYFMAHKYFSEEEKSNIFSDRVKFVNKYCPKRILDNYASLVPEKEGLNSVLFMDLKIYLAEDILVKIDRMSMNNSLESRIPFLDNFLSEYSAAVPFDYKLRFGEKKFILKKALRGKLPKKILTAKKQGFGIPLPEWVYGTLNERINSLFYENGSQMQKFFRKEEIEKIISRNSPKNNATKAWALLSFAVWHKIFIEETDPKKVF